ncbi:MAG: hypothetical protein DRN92_03130 [Thermoproteota archaeon]|nr:MAG: hypothetical protein DRN92_03130 [Candidatus Korarchaeota archaeon]
MVRIWLPAEAIAKLQAYDGTNWQNLLVQSSDYKNLRVTIYSGNLNAFVGHNELDSRGASTYALFTSNLLYGFNGSSWDRLRALSDSDGISNILGNLAVISKLYGYNGSTFDRLRTHYDSGNITVRATGTTSTIDSVTGFEKHTWTQTNDASSSAPEIKIEGSLDGSNWFELDTSTAIGSEMRHVVNKPVRYIRFNVVSLGDATSITLRYYGFR